ncbi:hypothetical protein K461DRAFT_56249 [Myriangium duriaei CBS 260.36]|uniref:Uncharacterized protein n=1 Tax=Myriangium duriaei CBS 260.36 TaxID=1168546 RepID=A0A9P4IS44_9PEZI|nr:hypothetical protein K461DRAFT_56249 [Myriangium duriaei CBS 260.36]
MVIINMSYPSEDLAAKSRQSQCKRTLNSRAAEWKRSSYGHSRLSTALPMVTHSTLPHLSNLVSLLLPVALLISSPCTRSACVKATPVCEATAS